MAYCIFVIGINTLHIQDWGVLNLMGETSVVQKCTCELKSLSKKCNSKAKYEKNGRFFCETHAKIAMKDNSWILRNKLNSSTQIKKLNREDLINMGTTLQIFTEQNPAPKTKILCLECILGQLTIIGINPIVSKKKQTAGDVDLITIGRNMKKALDDLVNTHDITHVILENQISTIASRMKTVQGMLSQYYIMQPNSPYIEFVSSSNKLKHLVRIEDSNADNIPNAKDTYKQHKKDSIVFCNKFLDINPGLGNWRDIMNTSKKDDLADAFLQGVWYLKHTKLITYADNLNINSISLS
jgi:hypothetical protein